MKKLISNYTFDSSQGIVTLTDLTSIDLERLLLITNVTDNIIVYNFADPQKGGIVSGNSINLNFDTSAMSNGDILQIYYEDATTSASEETLEALVGLTEYLKILVNQTKTLATQDINQRQRVVVENTLSMPTINANTTSTYGEITPRQEGSRNAFANGIRQNLTF